MEKNIILYTALFGDYDDLKDHKHPKDLSFCFTDRTDLHSDAWTIIKLDKTFKSIDERIRFARYYKTNPHVVLPEHEYSIWIDASLKLNDSYLKTLDSLEKNDIATFKYPYIYGERNCAYIEADACINRGKDSIEIIKTQMDRYKKEGFPKDYGLVETTMVVRRNTTASSIFNEHWWDELRKGSRRDQLSFNYTSWKTNISYALIPGHRLDNPFSENIAHKEKLYRAKSNWVTPVKRFYKTLKVIVKQRDKEKISAAIYSFQNKIFNGFSRGNAKLLIFLAYTLID